MTAAELPAVEAVLTKALADPMGFTERLLAELVERLAVPQPGAPVVVPGYASEAHEALVDRNLLLAAALGACMCWGEDAGCGDCRGAGAPGWMPPDPELFTEYVTPAVRRTTQDTPPTAHESTDHGEENHP